MLTKMKFVQFLILGLLLSACTTKPFVNVEPGTIRIHDIQGCSHISPYVGKNVTSIPGIVTYKNNSGFYLQDDKIDTLDCSSESIYVFTESFTGVLPGDRLIVSGRVSEFSSGSLSDQNLSITELVDPKFEQLSSGNRLPEPVTIGGNGRQIPDVIIEDDSFEKFDPLTDGLDFYESLESMIVQVDSGVVTGPRNQFNEVVIIPTSFLPNNLVSKDGALIGSEKDPNPERIILNLNDSNQEKVSVGAELTTPAIGILDYSFGSYKLYTFGKVDFTGFTPEKSQLDQETDSLLVASYNVENLSRFDGDSKFRKIAGNIVKDLGSPEIMIIHEVLDDSGVEDDGVVTAEQTINLLLSSIVKAGGPEYHYIDGNPINNSDGGVTGGNIRSVILYREDRGITLLIYGFQSLIKANPTRIGTETWKFDGTRKPLVGLFSKDAKVFMVVTAHLTSRNADSPVFGKLQPIEKPEEAKRNLQAEYINRFAEKSIKENPDLKVIVAGDMNDDPWSRTISAMEGSLLVNLGKTIPENERYSYILDGNATQLDYIFVSNTDNQLRDRFMILHINSLFDHTQQVSDHDAVIAIIDLTSQ